MDRWITQAWYGVIYVLIVAMFFLAPFPLPAQQASEPTDNGRPPRPDLAFDHDVNLGRGGNLVRVFRESGREADDPDARLFYEPPIFLVTDKGGDGLKTHITDTGHLVLYVHWDTNIALTKKSIRRHIIEERDEKTVPSLGKINYFFVSDSWFESRKTPEIKSEPLKNHSFARMGEVQIHFRTGSREAAEAFIADLHAGRDQLEFFLQL